MNESNIKGISVRAIIVLFLIIIFTITVFTNIKSDALNSMVMAAIGWYFGQKSTTADTSLGATDSSNQLPPKDKV